MEYNNDAVSQTLRVENQYSDLCGCYFPDQLQFACVDSCHHTVLIDISVLKINLYDCFFTDNIG